MQRLNGKQHNPIDPITKREAAPDPQRELFNRYSHASDGFPADHVINAAASMLINAIRQTYPNRQQAEVRFDELFGKSRALLLDHYDGVTGKRRNIFPFTQQVHAAHVIDRDKKG